MHQDPEHQDWDDDEYKYYPAEYNEYGYPKDFKFDWSSWEKWLKQAIEDIVKEGDNTWLVNPSKKSNKVSKNEMFAYLGSNSYNEPVWKNKYFVDQKINQQYNNHIIAHAAYFLKQPAYYKGLFDILN
jgi:hypothetical protein